MTASPRARSLAVDAALVLGSIALALAVTLFALRSFTDGVEGGQRRELVIQAGTAAAIAQGRDPELVPSEWTLYDGDLLVLDNRDTEPHRLADWIVPAGSALEIPLSARAPATLTCSLHPDGEVRLDVLPASVELGLAAGPALLAGSGLGAVAVLVRRVVGRLGD